MILTLEILFRGLSEFLPDTRHVWQVETWFLRGVNPHHTPRILSAAKLSKAEVPQALAPQVMAGREYIQSFPVGAASSYFCFLRGHTQLAASLLILAQNSSQVSAAQLSAAQLSSAAQRLSLIHI